MGVVNNEKVAFMDYIDDEKLEKELLDTFTRNGYTKVVTAYRDGNNKLVKHPNAT